MTIPLLMGSLPAYTPLSSCDDGQVYFWLGFILAMALAVVLSLAVRHIFK